MMRPPRKVDQGKPEGALIAFPDREQAEITAVDDTKPVPDDSVLAVLEGLRAATLSAFLHQQSGADPFRSWSKNPASKPRRWKSIRLRRRRKFRAPEQHPADH